MAETHAAVVVAGCKCVCVCVFGRDQSGVWPSWSADVEELVGVARCGRARRKDGDGGRRRRRAPAGRLAGSTLTVKRKQMKFTQEVKKI